MIDVLHNFWFLVAVTVIVCSVTATIAQAWQKVRRGEQEMMLKQEMIRRGLSVEEMERVLRANSTPRIPQAVLAPSPDEIAIEQLVKCLGEYGVSGRVIEQVMSAVQSADPYGRASLSRTIRTLLENSALDGDARDEQLLAVVRAVSVAGRPAEVEDAAPAAAANPSRIDETFQPVRPV